MKFVHHFAAGLLSAAALAVAGTVTIHAQSQSGPAYLVVELDVKDQDGFMEYATKATNTVSQYGGSFIVLATKAQTIEGADPNGVITIIEFGSIDEAQNWLNSSEYGAVKGIRHATAETRQYLVEGLPNTKSLKR